MPHRARVLVIEDEVDIARLLQTELTCEGFEVVIARDGLAGLTAARDQSPDLLILDRMLPGLDGLEVCRRLRRDSQVPILMLTAKSQVLERVEGLDAGANDYLVKPFDLEELLARVRVQLRQSQAVPNTRLQFQDLSMDLISREVRRGEQIVALTPKEFELLKLLLQHPRQVMPRSRLIEAVWGWDFEGDDNILEVYIRYLRQKIDRPHPHKLIHTARGVGYVLKEVR